MSQMNAKANPKPVPALALDGITVRFPDTLACDNVGLEIFGNEIFALVGENGAGKTTLMNAIFGLVPLESGGVRVNGRPLRARSPRDAISAGIGMVHQHFMLVPSFTVAQNIALGAEPRKAGLLFDSKTAIRRTNELSERYGLKIPDPNARVADLSIGMQQRVEILKTLSRGLDILILDEPTAVLTPGETDELFAMLRVMAREMNKTVIIITHKLYEVMAISDRVGVMRHGKLVDVLPTAEVDEHRLAELMIGHDRAESIARSEFADTAAPPVIDVKGLCANDDRGIAALDGVSLSVRAGEILGIAGVSGNGQTELEEAITGLRPITGGDVYISGWRINGLSPARIRQLHITHVPEDRQRTGLSPSADITDNIIAGRHNERRFRKPMRLINRKETGAYAAEIYKRFDVRGGGTGAVVGSLSGGNMQKVVIGRELSFPETRAIVIAQPTRGVDIGASEFIHEQILKKRAEGMAILLISADLDELIRISDRIATMFEGRITAVFDAKTATKEQIGEAMLTGATASP